MSRRSMTSLCLCFLACLPALSLLTMSRAATAQDAGAPGSRFAIPATDDGVPGTGTLRRSESFQRTWTTRRQHFAERAAQEQGTLVFLGDSITQGWGDDLKGAFADVKVANRGISGDTTRGVLLRLKDDVLNLKPSGVVLLIGTNDLADGDAPESIAGNVKLIVAQLLEQNPKLPIVLCTVFPSAESKSRPVAKIVALNTALANAVKGNAQVTVVDTYKLFSGRQNSDAKVEEFPDLLHPNDLGYAKWAAGIRPVLATLGYVDTQADTFQPEPGFTSLFNGKDLTGWGFRAMDGAYTGFDGKAESNDGRYVAKNGRIIVTTPPEGRRIQQLWTEKKFPKEFVLKLEFRCTPNADSGIFIRDKQLQCRDYPLAGPYFNVQKYKPQDWNEVIITVKGTSANCTCNGEVLEAAFVIPETGAIGLEGDRGQIEYRRLRLQETN